MIGIFMLRTTKFIKDFYNLLTFSVGILYGIFFQFEKHLNTDPK